MEQNTNELFYHCVQILNEYNSKTSEKAFLEEYFQFNEVSNQSFVSIVLIDCNHHSALIKIIMESFYKIDEIIRRKSEENIYKVIIYIIFFQLESVGFQCLREFIYAVKLHQIHQFLLFLVNETHLLTIKTECMKLYEEHYINEKIIRVIQKYSSDLRDLAIKIKERPLSEPTKLKPFNLTTPKPRIPKVEKCRSVTNDQNESRKILKDTHHQSLPKLNATRSTSATEKSSKIQNKQTKITEENLPCTRFRANPLPKSQINKIPVKLNVASVLKENQFFRKQEDDILRRLNDLEAGGNDGQEFLQWQQTKQKQDYEEEINTIERKKLEGKISYEEAVLAKQRLIDENRQKVDAFKRQTRETIEIHVRNKLKEEKQMKQLIEDVVNGRDNAKIAQQKLRQYKTDFVKQYKEDTKQLMKQTLEEAEVEMRQRVELIQQIRAVESIRIDRSKPIDLTSITNYGVPDEMSIDELRKRLKLLKLEREKERQSRHDQIMKEKQIKEKLITNTVQHIAKYRNELTTQTVIKRQRNTSAPPSINRNNSEVQQSKPQSVSKEQQQEKPSSSNHSTSFRSTNEWNRLEKSLTKSQKPLAPSLLA